MRSEADIKRDVEAELKWRPEVDETDIAVKVHGSEVTLSGFSRNYFEKCQAETIVRGVLGVSAVANDLQVKPPTGAPSDPEIARAAVMALKLELPYVWEQIKTTVTDGRVNLQGNLEWQYQREQAERAVRRLQGVLSLNNEIKLKPRIAPEDIKHRIEDAFRRIATVDADHIRVDAQGSVVTLHGEVRSWAERDQAQRTAWAAPGVTRVNNSLTVRV